MRTKKGYAVRTVESKELIYVIGGWGSVEQLVL